MSKEAATAFNLFLINKKRGIAAAKMKAKLRKMSSIINPFLSSFNPVKKELTVSNN